MYEIFMMSLKDFWCEGDDMDESTATEFVNDFQEMLSEHYGMKVSWEDRSMDEDQDIEVSLLSFEDIIILQAYAAKLELDGNLDDFKLDSEDPWSCEIFERIQQHIDDEKEIKRFPQIFTLDSSPIALAIPVDLPAPITVDLCDEDEEEGESEEGFESIDILSQSALRKELDDLGLSLGIDIKKVINLDEDFGDDGELEAVQIGWYTLSEQLNSAIKGKLPLFVTLMEDDDEDDEDIDDEE